jgi:hypothetical protein
MVKLEDGRSRYAAWIKMDDTLPWIELGDTFGTKSEARLAAKQKLSTISIKIVKMSMTQSESERNIPLIKIRASH